MTYQMEVVDGNGESLGLPEHFLQIPLAALRCSVRTVIALYLDNPTEIVDEKTGYVNNYNGLAEFAGFTHMESMHFSIQKCPTKELLKQWEPREDLKPTIGKLWEGLYILGRFDVMKDCQLGLAKDVESFLRKREKEQDMIHPVQGNDVENKTPHIFDAFVSYNHDGVDLSFVQNMIQILEGEPHKLKLFIPGRDDLPGRAKHVLDIKLIEARCRRMVIILSNNYLRSSACDFLIKFAHTLSPGARSKKLIPVIIEPVREIPQILRYVNLFDYTKVDLQEWFWNRLASTITHPLDPTTSDKGQTPPMYSTPAGTMSSIASSSDSAM